MKKLLTLLTFVFCTTIAFSQNVIHLRAFELTYGFRDDSESPISWAEEKKPVSILIKIEENKATIYSKEIQIYRLINQVESNNEKMLKYYCSNNNGINCNLLMFTVENAPGIVFLGIEFNDMVWYYATKPE